MTAADRPDSGSGLGPGNRKARRGRVRATMVVAALLGCAAPAAAQGDVVLGLLALPDVFGTAPCDRFMPSETPLFEKPDARSSIGSIRVARHWTFHADGGCADLLVNVHRKGDGVDDLPTREYAYEAPAAIVLERRRGWYKLRLGGGAAWVRASERTEYHPLEQLLVGTLTYLTSEWDGTLSAVPESAAEVARGIEAGRMVRVVQLRRRAGRLWAQVEVLSHSECEAAGEPAVVARGWTAVHASSGEPTIWFFSRGC